MSIKKALWGALAAAMVLVAAAGYFFLRYSGEYLSSFYLKAAQTAEEKGKESRAAWLYEESVEKNPENIEARMAFALLHERMGNVKKAEEEWLACTRESGGAEEAYAQLSRLYVAQGRVEEAVALISGVQSTVLASKLGALRPAAPAFAPAPGHYGSETTVTLRAQPEDAVCYFTTDGSFPTLESDRWEEPLTLPVGTTTIRAVTISEEGVVSLLTEVVYQIDDLSAVVNFKDETVETMVRAALGRYTGRITVGETKKITALSNKTEEGRKIGGEIGSFSDFQYLRGLTTLDLSDLPGLPDLNGLSVLSSLETLRLENCGLTDRDVMPVRSFGGLKTLDLSDNRLTSLAAAAELTGLNRLAARSNFISDVTPLLLLPSLESLDLSDNPIGSLETVGCIASLEILQMADCGVASSSGLSGLRLLKSLDLSGNRLRELEGLAGCLSLETLAAADNLIGNLHPLSGLLRLQAADLKDNRIVSLRPLADAAALRTLNVSRNQISDLSPLAGCGSLETVMAAGNPLDGEEAVAAFSGIQIYVD